MNSGWGRSVVVVAACVVALAACVPPPSGSGGGSSSGPGLQEWNPQSTDPAIRSDPTHTSFSIRAGGTPRHELVVLFNGTGAAPSALTKLGRTLSSAGFHVVGLRYDSGTGTRAACPNSVVETDPDCHRSFRSEVVFGSGVPDPWGNAHDHPKVNVTAPNSVMNRLVKQIDHLHRRNPLHGWDTFQVSDDGVCTATHPVYGGCDLDWTRIVVMGHSQGAGVSLYLSQFFPVARVGMLSGPADVFSTPEGRVVAPWIADGVSVTAPEDIGVVTHVGDPALGDHRAAADALELPGPEISTTLFARPYFWSRQLTTALVPACPLLTGQAHNATATDLCAPNGMRPVWEYLATGEE